VGRTVALPASRDLFATLLTDMLVINRDTTRYDYTEDWLAGVVIGFAHEP
jgi:hypothetical protein